MGSGGSRSLLPPGKLFEVHGAGTLPSGPERLQSGSVSCFDACRVHIESNHVASTLHLASAQAIKLLEVIWSSLTGN